MSTHMKIMKRQCTASIHLHHFPGEIMNDILSRLPCQTLSQSMLVCKDWYNFIKDPAFIKLHHSRMSQDDPSLFMLHNTGKGSSRCSELYSVHDNKLHPTSVKAPQKMKIVGSSNGLMCVSLSPFQDLFYILNPITREILELPKADARGHGKKETFCLDITSTGFAFDAPTETYKVIRTWYLYDSAGLHHTGIEIHTLGSGIWRSIEEEDIPCKWLYNWDRRSQVFVNGALHWQICLRNSELEHCIGAIDIGDEKFIAFGNPPKDSEIKERFLGSLRECLCVTDEFNNHFVVWIMKQYGQASSWTREHVIRKEVLGPLQGVYFKTVNTMNNGSVLLCGGGYQGYYDLEKKEFEQILIDGIQSPPDELLEIVVHVNSLISPASIAGIGEEDRILANKTASNAGIGEEDKILDSKTSRATARLKRKVKKTSRHTKTLRATTRLKRKVKKASRLCTYVTTHIKCLYTYGRFH